MRISSFKHVFDEREQDKSKRAVAMMTRTSVLVLLFMVCFAVSAIFWSGCTGLRLYEGRVVDADTGRPIANARVETTFFVRGKWCPHGDGLFVREPVGVYATTDRDGKFRLRSRKNHLPLFVYGPPGKPYRHSLVTWKVDEKNPEGMVIPMKRGE